MPQPRLPGHIVIQLLIRLDAEEPVLKIHNKLGVARSAVYRIRDKQYGDMGRSIPSRT
jgi:hypothetical protein